jgi:spore germination protein GerM
VRLYFGDPSGFGLKSEDRTIVAGPTLTERLQECVRELAAGSLKGLAPSLPPSSRLMSVFVDPWGLAYLDFNRGILGERVVGDGQEWLIVASLVRTVCDNFPEVREVRLLVGGQVVTSLGGYVDLEEPLTSDAFPLVE